MVIKSKMFLIVVVIQLLLLNSKAEPFQHKIGGVTYGSNSPKCYQFCSRGDYCKIHASKAICTPLCGDGILVGKEKNANGCDDGNNIIGDGCSQCVVDKLYSCRNDLGKPSVCKSTCGDGIINSETGQNCDDGNQNNTDGCSNTCQINNGWICVKDGKPQQRCNPKCGDGLLVGFEVDPGFCDDKNTKSGDGCSSSCKVQWSHTCCGTPSVCTKKCGNGVWDKDGNQECDNGKTDQGCNQICQIDQPHWTCHNTDGYPSACSPVCGDGKLVGKQLLDCSCDDKNSDQTDGCLKDCTVDKGWKCEGEPSKCAPICGDGILVGNEKLPGHCDDGNKIQNDGCENNCLVTKKCVCHGEPSKCQKTCGNGKYEPSLGEECDDDNNKQDDGCSEECQIQKQHWECDVKVNEVSKCSPICKDGKKYGSEADDDQYCYTQKDDPGCKNCKVEDGFTCKQNGNSGKYKCDPICSDGKKKGSELTNPAYCYQEEGKQTNGCKQCKVQDNWECQASVGNPERYSCKPKCQDGVMTAQEAADKDYCYPNGNGCKNCKKVEGWDCNQNSKHPGNYDCKPICEDGIRIDKEKQNTRYCYVGGDGSPGCDPKTCTQVDGWKCKIKSVDSVDPRKEVYECEVDCSDGKRLFSEKSDEKYCYVNDENRANEPGCNAAKCKINDGWVCKPKQEGSEQFTCSPDCYDGIKIKEQESEDYCYVGKVDSPGCIHCKTQKGFKCTQNSDKTTYTCTRDCIKQNSVAVDDKKYCYQGAQDTEACKNCQIQDGWVCKQLENGLSQCKPDCRDGRKVGSQLTDPKYCYSGEKDTHGCKDCKIVDPWTCEQNEQTNKYECKIKCPSIKDGDGDKYVKDDDKYCNSGDTDTNSCKKCRKQDGYDCVPPEDASATFTCKSICDDFTTQQEKNDVNYCLVSSPSNGCINCKQTEGWKCYDSNNDGIKDKCQPDCRDGKKIKQEQDDKEYCFVSSQPDKDTTGCKDCKEQKGYDCKVKDDGIHYQCSPICQDGFETKEESEDKDYCFVGAAGNQYCVNCKVKDDSECKKDNSGAYKCNPKCRDGVRTGSELTDQDYCFVSSDESKDTAGCKNCKIQKGWDCDPKQAGSQEYKCEVICDDGQRIGDELTRENYCYTNPKSDGCVQCTEQPGWSCKQITKQVDSQQVGTGNYDCKPKCEDGIRIDKEKQNTRYCYVGGDGSPGCDPKTCTQVDGWKCKIKSVDSVDPRKEVYECEVDCSDGKRLFSEKSDEKYCYVNDENRANEPGCNAAKCKINDGWVCKPKQEGSEQFTCSPDCKNPSRVGDELTKPNYCYTSNPVSQPGCDMTKCEEDIHYTCSNKKDNEQEYECKPKCQDGYITPEEANDQDYCYVGQSDNQGCKKCKQQKGWKCEKKDDPKLFVCEPECGDQITIEHEVDEGNCDVKSAACNDKCKVNDGWQCKNKEGQKSNCKPKCGDGKFVSNQRQDPKYCDDGNKQPGDGCSADCQVEHQHQCDSTNGKSKCHKFDDCIEIGDNEWYCYYDCGKSNWGKHPKICNTNQGYCNDFNSKKGDGCDKCVIQSGYVVDNVVVDHDTKPNDLEGFRISHLTKCGNQVMDPDQTCDYSYDNHDCKKHCNYAKATCGNNEVQLAEVCDYFWGCKASCQGFQDGWVRVVDLQAAKKSFKVSNSRNIQKDHNVALDKIINGYYPKVIEKNLDLNSLGWSGLKLLFNINSAYFSPGDDYDQYNSLKLAVELVAARLWAISDDKLTLTYSGESQLKYLKEVIQEILESGEPNGFSIQLKLHSAE